MSIAAPLPIEAGNRSLAADVAAGLGRAGQKTLPCKYLYDETGSRLFEAISTLPEYGLTAADARILRGNAEAILADLGGEPLVAELGSGSAQKTKPLLQALVRRQAETVYMPIEISPAAIERSRQELAGLRGLKINAIAEEYLPGMRALAKRRCPPALGQRPLLVLFLGSTIGNFEPREAGEFLAKLRILLRPGDGLLLGADLVKPVESLRLAYDDPAGVTAAFNLNLLARLNRECGADFNLRHWAHQVRYRAREQRIEMHLRSRREQTVRLATMGMEIRFRRGETIWTESSYKFQPAQVRALLAAAGFRVAREWCDQGWAFSETLGLV